MDRPGINPDLLRHVYHTCYEFALLLLDEQVAQQHLRSSYTTVLPYFYHLSRFDVNHALEIDIRCASPGENELLAFTVWMSQFLRQVQDSLVGFDNIDIRILTGERASELQEAGFYDYYDQAGRMRYS